MTYLQLFKLADFLSANEAVTTYIELEEETSFKEAFGDFPLAMVGDGGKAKGLYIVVFPESETDKEYLYNGILNYCKDIEFTSTIFMGVDRNGIDKIIIGVDETK